MDYYAATDAADAYVWGAAGTALGPLGTAVGIVIGGVGSSAWSWYWDQPSMIYLADDKFAQHFDNLNQQVGFAHNKFIVEFVNDNLNKFKNSTDFVDTLHAPLVTKLSTSFSMSTKEVESIFDKKKLVSDLDKFFKTFDELDTDIFIDNIVSIIQENYEDDKVPTYFKKVLIETADAKDLDVETYFDKKIEEVKQNKTLNELEQEIHFNALNTFKYALALWNRNIK
ncbi:hypothetical protein [Myroides sp. NP-2]|uniref:hypothetical protein n=1 Tax=Myroides sp. NP-2 TaxID=2759945 RepID=UPI0021065196|nr:hypothetical protein [Myroides sp. NP-2]